MLTRDDIGGGGGGGSEPSDSPFGDDFNGIDDNNDNGGSIGLLIGNNEDVTLI